MTPVVPTRRPGTARRAVVPVLLVAFLAVLAAVLWAGLQATPALPLSLTIDGETVIGGFDFHALSLGGQLAAVAVLGVVLVTVLLSLVLIVPLTLALALGGTLLALALGLGLPLLAVGAVVALLLSPLIALGWLLWRALRPSPTIAA